MWVEMRHAGGTNEFGYSCSFIFNTSLSGRLAMRRPALSLLLKLMKAIADEDAKGAKGMFDWNGNGKEDWGDRYIDYQIYNDIYHNEDEPDSGGGEGIGCGCLLLVIIAVLISSMF